MVFYAVVAVLVCMGGWFMVTTVGTGRASRNMLNATQTVPTWHTIRLWRFPNVATQRRAAQLLAGTPEMAALAGQHRFEVVEVSNDECALCVGRFRDPASPELARLLKEFADYSNGGIRPFERAEAMPIAR